MGKKKYRDVTERLTAIRPYDLMGSIASNIKMLQAIIDQHPDHTDIVIEWDSADYEYGDGEFIVKGTRKETDKERDKRLANARKERAKKAAREAEQEAAEREQLKQLLEKYGNN